MQIIGCEWEGCSVHARNLLDKSSVAQSLDGNRLTGSLHVPVVFKVTSNMTNYKAIPISTLCEGASYVDGQSVDNSVRVRPISRS